MNFIEVKSSNIASIGHDPMTKKMQIIFTNSSVYQYDDVTKDVFNAFVNAPSVGRYFHQNIRNAYTNTKIS